jgi:hypothetical protein
MAFSYTTFEEIATRVAAAREWFRAIGLSTSGSRLEHLEDLVQRLLSDLAILAPEEAVAKWGEKATYWALADAHAFCEIAEQFRNLPSHLLPRHKLATILRGPLDPEEENPADASVQARNVLAELELAADFAFKGLVPTGFDDLRVSFHDQDLWLECKRIHSHAQVGTHIQKATQQLSRNLPNTDARGLLAIVLDRLSGVDRLILRAVNDGDTVRAAAEVANEFLKQHTALFQTKTEHRLIGLALVLHFLVYSSRRNMVGIAFNLIFVPWDIRESRDRTLLEDLASHLAGRAPTREPPPSLAGT